MRFRRIGLLLALFLLAGCAGTKLSKGPEEQNSGIDREIAKVRETMRQKGTSGNAYFELAKYALAKGDTMQAFVYLDSSLALDPGHAEARLLKANLLYKRQQLRSAFEEYLVLLEADSSGRWSQQVGQTIGLIYPIRQLTSGEMNHANPSFSPDGRWIAFQGDKNKNWDLFLLNRETGAIRQLTNSPLDEEAPVFWGNSKIIFTRQQSAETHNRDIFVFDLSSEKESALVVHPADDWFPAVSPDSSRICFVSDRSQNDSSLVRVFVYDCGTKSVRPLFGGEQSGTAPSFSADGQSLLFTRLSNGYYRAYRSDPDGKNIRQIPAPDMHIGAPKFSPDGKKIVFFSKIADNLDIFELNLKTGHLDRLTAHPGRDLAPVYAPDGREIAFYSDRTGRYQIYVMDIQKPFSRLEIIKRLRAALNSGDSGLRNISGLVPVGQ